MSIAPKPTLSLSIGDSERCYLWLSVFLFVVLSIVILWTFRDYGVYWDEPLQTNYGEMVLRYLTMKPDITAQRGLWKLFKVRRSG